MITLYSLRTHIDHEGAAEQYYITKFVDGEVESGYITSIRECECPAGHRPSCRHRQMLPMMLASGIVNTHWFWDFDLGRVVDFEGNLKSNFDAMNELAGWGDIKPEDIGKQVRLNLPADAEPAGPLTGPKPSWRRL